MKKRTFCVFILIAFVCLVIPVSADLINDHYRVAPNIYWGATVFIGEQGLDINDALNSARNGGYTPTPFLNTIGWWASGADIHNTAPTVTVDLTGRTTNFIVTPAEFDGYEGQWYLVDPYADNTAKLGSGAVFNVKAPKLDVTVRDVGQNDGADVSGMSVPNGTKLQFQIGTNMYTVLSDPLLRGQVYNKTGGGVSSDGFLDIRVKYENGTTLTKLLDDNNTERTLIALNVSTQPYTWGRDNAGRGPGINYVWNTSTYPPGTYTVSVLSRLNNMQSNYKMGSAMYTGRTVSETKTISITGDIPPGTNTSTQIGIFRPSTGSWFFDFTKTGLVNMSFQFGKSADIPVVGDWNGDGFNDVGVFRSSTGTWYLDTTKTGVVNKTFHFGKTGDIPIIGDWDGNGISDIGVFRPATGTWYLDTTKTGVVNKSFQFGKSGDTPVVGKWI